MGRRTVPLDRGRLEALEGTCAECARWILTPLEAGRTPPGRHDEVRRQWVREVLGTWGTCGQVLLDGPRDAPLVVGLVTYAPPAHLPGLATLPTAPPAREAVVMVDLVVDASMPAVAGGKLLVQAMVKDLVRREVALVETFADTTVPATHGAHGCRHSVELLEALGFSVRRAHPRHPRMRMDLRSAATWLDEVGLAIDRVRGAVAPPPRPSGAGPQMKA